MSSSSEAFSQMPCRPTVAAGLAAAVSKHAHRGIKRRAGDFHIASGLLDARRGDLQIGVVRERLVDQCGEHRIVERDEP